VLPEDECVTGNKVDIESDIWAGMEGDTEADTGTVRVGDVDCGDKLDVDEVESDT
jgi:hypothetical protein